MYEAVLGKAGFRKGMDLYFQRHDGHAVTCDDFLAAMSDANGKDLSSLAVWYSQAGTPILNVSCRHDAAAGTFAITLNQTVPPTPGAPEKRPCLIPVRTALIGADGALLPLTLDGRACGQEVVLELTQSSQTFVFTGVGSTPPVPSVLRGFSAPVKCSIEGQTDSDLGVILSSDTDGFNRYEAGQLLAKKLIISLYHNGVSAGCVSQALISAFRSILNDPRVDG
jgi:aminopeptidase N